MSYDVAFWSETSHCKYSPLAIYRRLRRGLTVEGLKPVRATRIRELLRGVVAIEVEKGQFMEGRLGAAHVEIQLLGNAVLVDVRHQEIETISRLQTLLLDADLDLFDPQRYPLTDDDRARLYDQDYEEASGDPDPSYWVEIELKHASTHRFGGHRLIGAQVVNGVEYIFVESKPPLGPTAIFNAIAEGNSSLSLDRMTGGLLDGYASLAAVVHVPASVIAPLASSPNPRTFIEIFTAFADDDRVLYYQKWSPNDGGACASVISLESMPKRLKTIITTKYAFKG